LIKEGGLKKNPYEASIYTCHIIFLFIICSDLGSEN
jgi:hypothetical protein